MAAIISYCPNAQKTLGLFDRLLTSDVLDDICLKVTGQTEYQVHRDTTQYNKGRLLYIDYEGKRTTSHFQRMIFEVGIPVFKVSPLL